jgi:hypothetical protein
MVAPRVTVLPPGTFYRSMQRAGRLGDQHKVARVTNDRTMANALLREGGEGVRPLGASQARSSAVTRA